MLIIGLATVVVAIVLVVLACFAIPVLVELKKSLVELRQFIVCTEEQLKPVMNDLHTTLEELKTLTREASERVEEVKGFTEAVGETGRHVRAINSVMGTVTTAIAGSTVWMTGAKAAGRFVLDRISKKGGK
jgi:uncharacterized protein YoxC